MLKSSIIAMTFIVAACSAQAPPASTDAQQDSAAHEHGKTDMPGMTHPGAADKMASANKTSSVAPSDIPLLKFVAPSEGATIGQRVAIVFEGPEQLSKFTMDNPQATLHLHIALDDLELMPMGDQLIGLGKGRYVFIFDLPAEPGKHSLSLYWADQQHKKIEDSVQSVTVTVGQP